MAQTPQSPKKLPRLHLSFMVTHALAIGCSHTQCQYLEPEDRWSEIAYKKIGIYFFRVAGVANGLSHCVLQAHQYVKRYSPRKIKYVVLQKPDPIRFPWWGTDESGYRYPDGIAVLDGKKQSERTFNKLSKARQKIAYEVILDREKELLLEIRELFLNAHLAYYHYWSDYFKNIIYRPILSSINLELGTYAESIGYSNWGFIIDPKTIPGILDDEGDLIWNSQAMFEAGWTRAEKDTHPSRKYQEIVAQKVSDWVSELRTPESAQQLLRQAN